MASPLILAHARKVQGRNLWVWYWATETELKLVALTSALFG
jgi:hypothetical protein